MKVFKLFVLIMLAYLVQTIVISRFAILGVRADLLLIITALYAVTFGAEKGFLVGILCGSIQDIFGTTFFAHTIPFALLGFLIGTFKESVFGTEESVAFTAVSVAAVTNYVFELLFLFFFFGRPIASPLILLATLVISCLYNSLLAPLIYPLIRSSSQFLIAEE
jgi:rod shape-determining protein MreD